MAVRKADSWDYVDEEREKVLVPVRCHKNTHEEERPEEASEEKVWEVRRRWYIYLDWTAPL